MRVQVVGDMRFARESIMMLLKKSLMIYVCFDSSDIM